jgi:hypothetical protein
MSLAVVTRRSKLPNMMGSLTHCRIGLAASRCGVTQRSGSFRGCEVSDSIPGQDRRRATRRPLNVRAPIAGAHSIGAKVPWHNRRFEIRKLKQRAHRKPMAGRKGLRLPRHSLHALAREMTSSYKRLPRRVTGKVVQTSHPALVPARRERR